MDVAYYLFPNCWCFSLAAWKQMASLPLPAAAPAPAAVLAGSTAGGQSLAELNSEQQAALNAYVTGQQSENAAAIATAPTLATTTCSLWDAVFGNCSGCSLASVIAQGCAAAPDSAVNWTPYLVVGGLLIGVFALTIATR
jgi:hypothetical protein